MTGRDMTVAVRAVVLQRRPPTERRTATFLSTRRTVALVALIALVEVAWVGLLFELVHRAV
jgi:hypothetical protein